MDRVRGIVCAVAGAVCCLVCATTSAPAAEQKYDSSLADKLTALAAQEFKTVLPASSVEIAGPLDLKVSWRGQIWDAYLYNLYFYCQRNIENCGAAIITRANEFKTAHQAQEQPLLKSNLRIVVRDGAHVEQLEQRYGTEENGLVEPLIGDLWVMVVEDLPTSVLYPKPAEIKALGLSPDDGLKLAIENTKAAVQQLIPNPTSTDRHTLQVFSDDDFVTAFAFPDLWAPVAHTYGTLVVAIPSTDEMLLIGDDTPKSLAAIRKASDDEWMRAEKPLSRFLYRWSENGWVQIPDSAAPSRLIKVSP